jgi:hypothetical protein
MRRAFRCVSKSRCPSRNGGQRARLTASHYDAFCAITKSLDKRAEVTRIIGAPEEIRTPDPQIRSWKIVQSRTPLPFLAGMNSDYQRRQSWGVDVASPRNHSIQRLRHRVALTRIEIGCLHMIDVAAFASREHAEERWASRGVASRTGKWHSVRLYCRRQLFANAFVAASRVTA